MRCGYLYGMDWIFRRIIAALTREHGGWEQARLRTSDEVSAAIPGDASRRERAHGLFAFCAWEDVIAGSMFQMAAKLDRCQGLDAKANCEFMLDFLTAENIKDFPREGAGGKEFLGEFFILLMVSRQHNR